MVRDVALFVIGGALLYFGAEWLIRGAVGLATKLRVRPLIIGLTVVAYGTSAPELAVGVSAALSGRGGIAFGNAVGSNIANVGLILGLTSAILPPKVDGSLRRRELPTMVMSALLVPLLLIDGQVSRLEGAGLLTIALFYTYSMVRSSRTPSPELAKEAEEVVEAVREAVSAPRAVSTTMLVLFACAGFAALLVGGNCFVSGASGLALALGVPERIVGLTIVAIGTSVPELATSLLAARRGHSDIAVGNVIGSNIFNVLLILGASGLAGPLEVSLYDARTDIVGLVVMTAAAAYVLRREREISRKEGATLLLLYIAFLAAVGVSGRG